MSRSSYKGYFFCPKVIKNSYYKAVTKKNIIKSYFNRASILPNSFAQTVGSCESGRGLTNFVIRPGSATFKSGMFAFTRKPYVFPHKKKRRVK